MYSILVSTKYFCLSLVLLVLPIFFLYFYDYILCFICPKLFKALYKKNSFKRETNNLIYVKLLNSAIDHANKRQYYCHLHPLSPPLLPVNDPFRPILSQVILEVRIDRHESLLMEKFRAQADPKSNSSSVEHSRKNCE